MTITKISNNDTGQHELQSQSGRTECWLDGWIAVPDHLEAMAWETLGWCDLDIQDGVLVGITPPERPEPEPEPEIPDLIAQVQTAMMAFAATSTEIPDNYALDMPDLFPTWERVLAAGKPLKGGTILNDGGQLYRVNHDNTTPQEHQPPHGEGMTAVYTPINKTNAGTAEDPIPAVRGMEYVYGLIYKDPEDGKLYLCTRTGYNPGETVVLQYLPHELVSQYFEVYTG